MASCALNGTTSTFTYGSDGLRRRMVTGTNTTDYLLDGQSVVREIKNGVVNATYLNGPRGPEYKRDQNGAVQRYLYDGLGSVVGLVDESGNVTNSRKYDVYGAPRNAQAGSAHCFVGGLGHTSDAETGLIYMRARYMDPTTGRFVSEDPAGDGDNWYTYCENDPVDQLDPTGESVLSAEYDAGVVAAGSAALARVLYTITAYIVEQELAIAGVLFGGSLVMLASQRGRGNQTLSDPRDPAFRNGDDYIDPNDLNAIREQIDRLRKGDKYQRKLAELLKGHLKGKDGKRHRGD